MLLTDDEIKAANFVDLNRLDYEVFEVDQSSVMEFARAIEAAILAKLGAMELPEPLSMGSSFAANVFLDVYLPVHLQQAYAQGAAAQLSSEPVGEVSAGTFIHWRNDNIPKVGTPLYTRREAK